MDDTSGPGGTPRGGGAGRHARARPGAPAARRGGTGDDRRRRLRSVPRRERGRARPPRRASSVYDCNGQRQPGVDADDGRRAPGLRRRHLPRRRRAATRPRRRVVQIYTCNGGANQKWTLQRQRHDHRRQQSGLCLDVTGDGTANSTAGRPVDLQRRRPTRAGPRRCAPATRTPPTVPGNPRVSNLTCDTVTFAWNASTDNVGRRVLRRLPRRPAHDVGERHDAVAPT